MEGKGESVMVKIADTERYSWESVRAFHALCLNPLEHGRVTWEDEEAKLRFMHALVWHPATSVTTAAPTSP